MASTVIPANRAPAPKLNYLNNGHTLKSWLLTHRSQADRVLYLDFSDDVFFLGGFFAMLIRLRVADAARRPDAGRHLYKGFTMPRLIMVFSSSSRVPAVLATSWCRS